MGMFDRERGYLVVLGRKETVTKSYYGTRYVQATSVEDACVRANIDSFEKVTQFDILDVFFIGENKPSRVTADMIK